MRIEVASTQEGMEVMKAEDKEIIKVGMAAAKGDIAITEGIHTISEKLSSIHW